ncbi:MAG: hypothetical protein ACOX2D_09890 [Fermentimonas sp.]|jgi:hypothetical protein
MLPGPNYVYKCPNCGNLLRKGSLMSGNTFGAEIFSDGKRIAPMLPEFPELTKCKKCNTIFWLSKLKEIGTYQWGDKVNSHWKNADNAEFLNIEDYFRALNEGLADNMQEELFVRQRIWWAYNDRVRNGNNPFSDVNDEIMWRENCIKLISLLDASDLSQRIMIAELKRNLGDFDSCLEIIKKIDNVELNWLKKTFISECEKRNKWVVKLN